MRYELQEKRLADYPSDQLLKNRTYKPWRWKGIALSDDRESLEPFLNDERRIIDRTQNQTNR